MSDLNKISTLIEKQKNGKNKSHKNITIIKTTNAQKKAGRALLSRKCDLNETTFQSKKKITSNLKQTVLISLPRAKIQRL